MLASWLGKKRSAKGFFKSFQVVTTEVDRLSRSSAKRERRRKPIRDQPERPEVVQALRTGPGGDPGQRLPPRRPARGFSFFRAPLCARNFSAGCNLSATGRVVPPSQPLKAETGHARNHLPRRPRRRDHGDPVLPRPRMSRRSLTISPPRMASKTVLNATNWSVSELIPQVNAAARKGIAATQPGPKGASS